MVFKMNKWLSNLGLSLILLLLVSCSNGNDVPTTPNYPPNIFADVSGSYNMHYKGLGKLFMINSPSNGIMITSFYTDSLGKTYYLGLNVYFPEGKLTTGTFPIVSQAPDSSKIYGVAFFEVGNASYKQTFISYSGEITISDISNVKIETTFKFLAKDSEKNSVMIENGSLLIKEE